MKKNELKSIQKALDGGIELWLLFKEDSICLKINEIKDSPDGLAFSLGDFNSEDYISVNECDLSDIVIIEPFKE